MSARALSRRGFLRAAAGAGATLLVGGAPDALAIGESSRFRVGQIRYAGGGWSPRPLAVPGLMREVERRTSVETTPEPKALGLGDADLFHYPFLYIAGFEAFDPWTEEESRRLRRFLDAGGFLFADDCLGRDGFGFDESFRREAARLYPGSPLETLDRDHTIYRSFYLLDRPSGRRVRKPYLEGVRRGERTPIVYSQNDLSGAWAADNLGRAQYAMETGGARSRELAVRMGVNLVLYALTVNYKRDQIHIPFILRRRRI